MGIVIDDLEQHEGYAARRLPDGTLTGTWTSTTAAFTAYQPACGCGWQGSGAYPPDEAGEEAAKDAWYAEHATPLLTRAVPAGIRDQLTDLKQAVNLLAHERPLAARIVADETRRWAAGVVARTQGAVAVADVSDRLDRLAHPEQPPGLGL